MANYSVLKAAVQAVVKTNGNQEITGANMQSTLISIINSLGTGYQFMGVATPSTSPGTPDYNVFYIGGAGTYANFGISVTIPVGSIGVFKYNGSWTKEQIDVATQINNNLGKEINLLNFQVGEFDSLTLTSKDFAGIFYNGTSVAAAGTYSDGFVIPVSKNVTYTLSASPYSTYYYNHIPTIGEGAGTSFGTTFTPTDDGYVLISVSKSVGSLTLSKNDISGISSNVHELNVSKGIFGINTNFNNATNAIYVKEAIKRICVTDASLLNKKIILRAFGITGGNFLFFVNDTTNISDDTTPAIDTNVIDTIIVYSSTWAGYSGIKKITGNNGKVSIYVDVDSLNNNKPYISSGTCYNNAAIVNYDIDNTKNVADIEKNVADIEKYVSPIENLEWGISLNGVNSEAQLSTPIVLSQNGDSIEFRLDVLENGRFDSSSGYSFAKGLASNGIAVGVTDSSLAIRSDDNVWILNRLFSEADGIYEYLTIKIEYSGGNMLIYRNNVLVGTYTGQKTITIISFGHASATYGYWHGNIMSIKVNEEAYNLNNAFSNIVDLWRQSGFVSDEQAGAVLQPIRISKISDTLFDVYVINRSTGKYLRHSFQRTQGSRDIDGVTYNSLDVWTEAWVYNSENALIYQGNLNFIYKVGKVNGVSSSDASVNEDYHVGPQHGCEVMKLCKFFADGVEFNPAELTNEIKCTTFRFLMKSECYVVDSSYNTSNVNNYPKIVNGAMQVNGIHYLDAVFEVDNVQRWYNRFIQTRDAEIQYIMMAGGMVQGELAMNNSIILDDIANSYNIVTTDGTAVSFAEPSDYDSQIIKGLHIENVHRVVMSGENNIIHQTMTLEDNEKRSHCNVYTWPNSANNVKCYQNAVNVIGTTNPDTINAGDIISAYLERKIESKL